MKYVAEAEQILKLAKFLNFSQLYNAVGAALATNFYVGDNEQEILAFIKQNKLEKLSADQISRIIE